MRSELGRVIQAVLMVGLFGSVAAAGSPEVSAIAKGQYAPLKVSTAHFELEFSVPPDVGRGYAMLCEKGYSKFCKIFDVKPDEKVWDGKCRVYLFGKRAQFVKFAEEVDHSMVGAMSGGYTRPIKEDPHIVLFIEGRQHVKLQQTIIHEMTHVFLQLFHKQAYVPPWIHEGFAQYFEFSHVPGESREKLSRRVVKDMVRRDRAAPLSEFFISSFPPTDLASYAQSWSLIDFITGNSALCRKTGRLVLKIKDSSPEHQAEITEEGGELKITMPTENLLKIQEDALKDVFGVSISQFEIMWKRFVMANY